MNLFDDVITPEGSGMIVGFPDLENVEVRLKEGGLWNGAREKVREWSAQSMGMHTDQTLAQGKIEIDDTPRSPRTGRKLTGAALAKHQKKALGENQ